MRRLLMAVTALAFLTATFPAVAADTNTQSTTAGTPAKSALVKKHKRYVKRHHRKHYAKKTHHRLAMHKKHRKVASHKRHRHVGHKTHKKVVQKS